MLLNIKQPILDEERIDRGILSDNTTSPSEVINVLFETVYMLGLTI